MQTIKAKTIVSGYSECGWFGANYNMNIYKGCCHGCIYCDSRSSCYGVENFDTVRAKENALAVIRHDLKSKTKTGIVMTGAMSDPYNPFEETQQLTWGALGLLDRFGFGICICTKSDLVCRDIDVLHRIKLHSPVTINFTITTADDALCKKIEPNVCPTSARLSAMEKLAGTGINCGVLLMPVLPFINDMQENIEQIVRMAAAAGAKWIYAGSGFGVTLRMNQRSYFYEQLDQLFPGIKKKYMESYANSYECISQNNSALWQTFKAECGKYRLMYRMEEIAANIRKGYDAKPITLFD